MGWGGRRGRRGGRRGAVGLGGFELTGELAGAEGAFLLDVGLLAGIEVVIEGAFVEGAVDERGGEGDGDGGKAGEEDEDIDEAPASDLCAR